MQKLGNITKYRLNQHKLGTVVQASQVLNRADGWLQENVKCSSDEVRAIRLKDGVLLIAVTQAVWAQELNGHTSQLLKSLQNEFGPKIIQRIRTKSLTSL